jgi:hypothetical protein
MATEPKARVRWTQGTIWILPLMLGVSFALNWAYLGSGFLADEVVIVAAIEQEPLPFSRWRGAWSGDVTDLSWFGNPWWADPGAMGSFFRPLPSLVMEASLDLFGRAAFPLHLLAVVLHGVIAFLLVLILLPLCGSRAPPLVAGLVWLACEDHSMTVGFISFFTDVLCVFFVCLSLLAHLQWLRWRRPRWILASMLAVIAALGCKETAAVAPLVLVVTSFFFPRGGEAVGSITPAWVRGRVGGLIRDPLAWAPWIAVFVGFLALYSALGLGGMDNLTYNDPLAHPLRYLNHLVIHLPVMWLAAVTVFPPGAGFLDPAFFPPMALVGAIVFPAFLWVLGSRLRKPVVAWGLTLYLLALLPQLGTDAGERLMYLPFLFLAVTLAIPILDVRPLARRLEPARPLAPRHRRVAGWYLLVGVALAGAIMSARVPVDYIRWARPGITDPLSAASWVESGHERVVFLTTRDFFGMLMVPTVLEQSVGRDLDVHLVSASAGRATVEVLDGSSFVLRLDRRGWLTNFLAAAFRRSPELRLGGFYEGELYDVTILELTGDGTDVLAAKIDMRVALDDPGTLFLRWDGARYRPIELDSLPRGEPQPLDRGSSGAG